MQPVEVVSSHFPYLPIKLDMGAVVRELEALIDTGFEGDLAVPPDMVSSASPTYFSQWMLANGSRLSAPTYDGILHIGSLAPIRVTVAAVGGQAIIGRGVTDHFTLILDHCREVRLQL